MVMSQLRVLRVDNENSKIFFYLDRLIRIIVKIISINLQVYFLISSL